MQAGVREGASAAFPCVLLAAGASSRMGRNKLVLPVGGEPAVRRAARIALARCRPLIVVTGARREEVEEALEGVGEATFVFNPRWSEGMASSAIAGIGALPPDCPGFFLHHADMPFVTAEVFALLSRAAAASLSAGRAHPLALAAGRGGAPGHPVFFPASYIPAIRALGGGERLKPVLARLGCEIVETRCDGVLEDIDAPEDYAALLKKYRLPDPRA